MIRLPAAGKHGAHSTDDPRRAVDPAYSSGGPLGAWGDSRSTVGHHAQRLERLLLLPLADRPAAGARRAARHAVAAWLAGPMTAGAPSSQGVGHWPDRFEPAVVDDTLGRHPSVRGTNLSYVTAPSFTCPHRLRRRTEPVVGGGSVRATAELLDPSGRSDHDRSHDDPVAGGGQGALQPGDRRGRRHARARHRHQERQSGRGHPRRRGLRVPDGDSGDPVRSPSALGDRKSTRLNSSHANISYAVFCLKKKKKNKRTSKYHNIHCYVNFWLNIIATFS